MENCKNWNKRGTIEGFKKLNSSIEQFKKDNEDLINQLNDFKVKNNLEIEKLKLEYQARVEEAKSNAQIIASNNNKEVFINALGYMLGGVLTGIFRRNNSSYNDNY